MPDGGHSDAATQVLILRRDKQLSKKLLSTPNLRKCLFPELPAEVISLEDEPDCALHEAINVQLLSVEKFKVRKNEDE